MTSRVKRGGAVLVFALMGFVSLVVADRAGRILCAHGIACAAPGNCALDVCEGDARLNMLRIAIWFGPAIVFGSSAFFFGGRRRPLAAWMMLLVGLMVSHAMIMVAVG